ncbi:dipeptidase [bacterium]|nr:dipeptidase [bacterium]MCI0603349.1 dipeptidase [bacterium]
MKHFLITLLLCALVIAGFTSEQDDRFLKQAREILREVPLIDGHNDLPWQIRDKFKNHMQQVDLTDTTKLNPPFHTDIPRLKSGMVGGQFWSVYVPVERKGADAVRDVLEQMDVVYLIVQKYPNDFEMAFTAADIQRIHKKGKVASLIGIEGGHCINNSLGVLRQLFRGGARYMTLTHWSSTDWADAATADPKYKGLTSFGELVVKEMNRLGMLVDISHVSEQTMNDVLDLTRSPVIFSHSSARAISGHPRNVPDDVLKRLPSNGGVVMVNYATSFVSEEHRKWNAAEEAEKARLKELFIGNPDEIKIQTENWQKANPQPVVTLQQLADHIDHIRKTAGIDHIGIGADLDGIKEGPVGLKDVSAYPALMAELLKRGYTKEEVKKVAGLNVLRVMKKTEEVAATLQKEIAPEDRKIEEVDTPK